jgi:uncharacterized cupin superfamily protein
VDVFNLFTSPEPQYDAEDPEGFRAGADRFGPKIGASQMGMTVYELPPGQTICPYHYEYGCEEWLIVLDGPVVLRHPDGEQALERGDVVCFPEGPAGAHQVFNRGEGTIRVAMLSTKPQLAAAVYPDSDKIGVWPGDMRDHILVRRSSHVDYYDGEV